MKITYPDYQNSILNVSNSILKHYQVSVDYETIKGLDMVLKKNFRHIFLILLDGFGINLLTKYLPKESGMQKDFKKEITSVFPPTTVAATNAILSGLPPYSTGYLGWIQYFKNEDANVVVFRNLDADNPENILKENLQEKYLYYENIYAKIKKASPEVETFELFPAFRPAGFESFHDQANRIIEISKKKNRTFTYSYWTEPDSIEHEKGINSFETKAVVEKLNLEYERLTKALGNDSLLILIADHGVVDVEEINILADLELMNCLIRKPSIETRACTFFVKAEKEAEFLDVFFKKYGENFILYSKENLYQERLLGNGKKHPLLDDFIGDYLAVSIDKYLFNMSEEPSFKAHHAGLTKDEMMVPLIIHEKK
ncbi:MAG: alkaline phosphatase family protein [Bacilli bacterium]|nr:alkaline phosphatase family protein [Bacilli bacterium]